MRERAHLFVSFTNEQLSKGRFEEQPSRSNFELCALLQPPHTTARPSLLRPRRDAGTVIPSNFRKSTGEYLETITRRYTFSESDGVVVYDGMPVFDLRTPQPQIDLFSIRFDSATEVQSMPLFYSKA